MVAGRVERGRGGGEGGKGGKGGEGGEGVEGGEGEEGGEGDFFYLLRIKRDLIQFRIGYSLFMFYSCWLEV